MLDWFRPMRGAWWIDPWGFVLSVVKTVWKTLDR